VFTNTDYVYSRMFHIQNSLSKLHLGSTYFESQCERFLNFSLQAHYLVNTNMALPLDLSQRRGFLICFHRSKSESASITAISILITFTFSPSKVQAA
jgi:hypothetical protein